MDDPFIRQCTSEFFLDDTMYLEVRIATNRRCKMRIILECQSKMSMFGIGVCRFRHLREEETRILVDLIGRKRVEELADMPRFERCIFVFPIMLVPHLVGEARWGTPSRSPYKGEKSLEFSLQSW